MELPDSVILEMLKREVLLTKAKLHALTHEHILGERKLRTLKSQLRQVSFGCSEGAFDTHYPICDLDYCNVTTLSPSLFWGLD